MSSRSARLSEALRRTATTCLISRLYEATNEDVSCFLVERYAVSFLQTLDLTTEADLCITNGHRLELLQLASISAASRAAAGGGARGSSLGVMDQPG